MVLQLINRIFKKMFSSFAQLQEFQFSNHPLRLLTDKSEVGIFLNHLDEVYYPKPPDPGSSAASSKSKSSKQDPFTPWDVVVEKITHHKEDGDTDTRHEYLKVDLFCRRKSKQIKGYVIIDRAKKAARPDKKPAKDPKDPKKAGNNKSDDDGALTSDTAGGPSDAEAPLLPSSSRSPLSPAVASSGEETPVSPQLVSPALSEVSSPTQALNTSEVKRAKRGIFMGSLTESAEGSAARSVGVVHDSVVSLELVEPSHARDKIRWDYNPSGGLFGKRNYVEVQRVTFNERSLENQGTFQHSDEEWEKLKQEGAKAEQAYRQRGAYKYRRLNLHQLVSLASFLHVQQSKYTINGGQCFWYADVLIRLAADRTGAELTPGKHYDQRGKFRTAGIYDSAKWDEEYKFILDKSYDHVSAGRADHDTRIEKSLREKAEQELQEERRQKEEERRQKEEERRQKEEERRKREESDRKLAEAEKRIAELERLAAAKGTA